MDKMKDEIRQIICDTIRQSNGLKSVKACNDNGGYACSYRILCNQKTNYITQNFMPKNKALTEEGREGE